MCSPPGCLVCVTIHLKNYKTDCSLTGRKDIRWVTKTSMTIRELKPFCPFGMMGSMRAVPLSGAINFRQPRKLAPSAGKP
jgi:hypothetical protein